MSNNDRNFDSLAKGLAEERVSRGKALKLVGAAILGGLLASIPGVALAAPQTCVTCTCGTGQPCNPKSTTCAELRAFPAETTCSQACAKQNLHLCSAGQAFHCPQGCP